MYLKQNFYSYLYFETHRQEKPTHTNNHAEKEVARKELIASWFKVVCVVNLKLVLTDYRICL